MRWRYDRDRIEFFRTDTRVFDVRALTLDARVQASLGQGRDSSDGGFVSASGTRLSGGDQDVMKTIRARIEPFLSRAGVLVAEPGAGASVVVTDTPDVLDRIARYLDRENRALTRRVRLVFEELTVALSEQAQAGIDWNLIFSGARLAAGLAVPALAGGTGGQLGVHIVQGPFSGSEAVIRALGESVQLVRRSSVPILGLNQAADLARGPDDVLVHRPDRNHAALRRHRPGGAGRVGQPEGRDRRVPADPGATPRKTARSCCPWPTTTPWPSLSRPSPSATRTIPCNCSR